MYRVSRVRKAIDTLDSRNFIVAFVYDANPPRPHHYTLSAFEQEISISWETKYLYESPQESFAITGHEISYNFTIQARDNQGQVRPEHQKDSMTDQ